MTRNAVRRSLVLSALVSLALMHLLWPSQAGQPEGLDPKVLDTYVARAIGPVNMSGRTVALAGVESDPRTVYAGTAGGGVWKTTDGGVTWKCIFEHEGSSNIGDVAVSKSNPNIVWVGTGEHNPRNSVAWGDGIYKSTDGGATWKHMGLKDSHSIGRIAIHPTNPDIVYVAVLGHLWGPNKDRGIYKTTDGGKSWEMSKFLDDKTGFVDLKMDPSDPNILYGSAYRVERDGFSGGDPAIQFGPLAGLYKTSDGGGTWEKMTDGLPKVQVGRSGIDIYQKDPNVVYAVIQSEKAKGGGGNAKSTGNIDMGGVYRSEDKGKTWKHLNTLCPRPFYYCQIRVDPNDDKRIYVLGVTMYISDNGGSNFESPAVFSSNIGSDTFVHADHHALWVNPKNSNEVYDANDGGVYISRDKCKSLKAVRAMPVGQCYGISVDMSKPYYVYGGFQDNGSWGGPSANYTDGGIRRPEWYFISGGDGFHTANDPTDADVVYTESQNGNLQRISGNAKKQNTSGFMPGGGPGGKGAFKKEEPGKKDDPTKKDETKKDDPKKKDEQKKGDPQKGDPGKGGFPGKGGGKGGGGFGGGGIKPGGANRWNWSTPMWISPHDPGTFYVGSQFLYRSTERGLNPKQISPDLTYGPGAGGKGGKKEEVGDPIKKDEQKKDDPKKGDPGKGGFPGKGGGGFGGGTGAHSLFTIGESPKKRGILWTGSDDGRIMLSRDAGGNWTDVSEIPGLPKDRCVSRVSPSHFAEGTCYVSITRYRNDDRKPYIFKTTDFGQTWQNISNNLPEDGSVHVVIESSKNKDLLFCGTEFALYASLNGGASWHRMMGGMPTVAVHDVVIHPRERDLVVGTHGRSFFVFDNIGALEQLTPAVAAKPAHLFDARAATAFKVRPSKWKLPDGEFEGKNPAYGAILHYRLQRAQSPAPTLVVLDAGTGKHVATIPVANKAGLHQVVWNLRPDGQETVVSSGEYLVVLQIGEQKQYKMLRVDAE